MPAELRERLRRTGAPSFVERRRPRVVGGPDAVARVVDRVVAAPQDPVVGRQPEVVELVARVRHALAPRPADRRPLVRRQRLGHRGRSRRPARTAGTRRPQPARVGRGRDDDVVRLDRRARRRSRRRRRPPGARSAVDRACPRGSSRPALRGDRRARRRAWPGRRITVRRRPAPDARPARAASGPRPGRRPGRGTRAPRRAAAASSTHAWSSVDLVRLVATSSVPVSSRSQSIPSSRTNATSSGEVRDALRLEDVELVGEVAHPVGQAVGQRRLAEAAVPAARPAADPVSASRTATRSDGSVSGSAIAVHSPVNPAPTIATSAGAVAAERRPRRARRRRSRTSSCRRRRAGAARVGIGRGSGDVAIGANVRGSGAQSRRQACGIRSIDAACGTIFVLTPASAVWHDRAHVVPLPATRVP